MFSQSQSVTRSFALALSFLSSADDSVSHFFFFSYFSFSRFWSSVPITTKLKSRRESKFPFLDLVYSTWLTRRWQRTRSLVLSTLFDRDPTRSEWHSLWNKTLTIPFYLTLDQLIFCLCPRHLPLGISHFNLGSSQVHHVWSGSTYESWLECSCPQPMGRFQHVSQNHSHPCHSRTQAQPEAQAAPAEHPRPRRTGVRTQSGPDPPD